MFACCYGCFDDLRMEWHTHADRNDVNAWVFCKLSGIFEGSRNPQSLCGALSGFKPSGRNAGDLETRQAAKCGNMR